MRIAVVAAFLVTGAILPAFGRADPPIVSTSTIGTFVPLGTADDAGAVPALFEKVIVIRDFGSFPVQGALVEIRFGDCTGAGEFRLCETQTFPGITIDCTQRSVATTTDALGRATFRIRGAALNPGVAGPGAPGAGLGDGACAEVIADGVILGNLRVKAYDQDGRDGLTPVDLSLFLGDRFQSSCQNYPRAACATYRSRSDFNDDGTINVVDLSLFLQARFSPLPQRSCAGATCAP